MTFLIFGKTGQVARELQLQAPEALCLGRDQVDLNDPEACAAHIARIAPKAVINAAAWTAVDRAEAEEDAATIVNGDAPAAMARACAAHAIPFVHISTDYVFDGMGNTPFAPEDRTAPIGAYGRSKLVGEKGVLAAGGIHAILRTSWVVSAHGNNFVKTMLRLSAERDRLSIVADQTGGPTPARAIASACLTIADILGKAPDKAGIYHFSGAPDVSWAGFARAIFAQAKRGCIVEGVPTSAYPTPAKRPLNSRLDCTATEAAFGLARPDWQAGLADILSDLEKGAA